MVKAGPLGCVCAMSLKRFWISDADQGPTRRATTWSSPASEQANVWGETDGCQDQLPRGAGPQVDKVAGYRVTGRRFLLS
jgi:hypothetical protein